uniref:Hypothetical capsid protein n=1 Tax=uncultured virus TaxID=340016 RepID=A0A1D8MJZ9_9VIRU|nr:hypothetical capsid protein [uncultured virus]
MSYVQYIGGRSNSRHPAYNPRYGARVGYTTRRFPGRFRAPSRMAGGRRFRRLNRRGLQNFVLNLNEKKFYDEFVTVTDANRDGSMFCLTEVVPGTSVQSRVGDKIVMRNLTVRGRIFYDWSDTSNRGSYGLAVRVRILIFIWKDDTEPEPGDVVDSSISTFSIDACSFMLDHDRKVKRKLLWDQTYDIKNDNQNYSNAFFAAPGTGSAADVKAYIDLSRLPIPLRTINYAASNLAGVNKIWMLIKADATPRPSSYSGPQVRINTRLSFTDS